MKIFSGFDHSNKNNASKVKRENQARKPRTNKKSKPEMIKKERPNLSAADIREKVRLHKLKNQPEASEVDGENNLEAPKQTTTTEKLKEVLRTGSFRFDNRTAKVLEKILGPKE